MQHINILNPAVLQIFAAQADGLMAPSAPAPKPAA